MGQLLFADAIHIREQAKIDAARITQKSGNERRGAETALQNFSATMANARRLDAAGSAVTDNAANITRLQDAATVGKVNSRLAAAEALGAAAANAAAAGVGGSSVEAYNQTVRLQTAIQEQSAEAALRAQGYAMTEQSGNAIKTAVAGMDNNIYRANLDYTQYVDHKKPSFFEKVIGITSTVAATVFGGPQAGAAVMGVFEARQASRNGDFAGASSAIMGSFQNGMSALQASQRTGGVKLPEAPKAVPAVGGGSSIRQPQPGEPGYSEDPYGIKVSPFRFKSPTYGQSPYTLY